jgi:hypothetical protein
LLDVKWSVFQLYWLLLNVKWSVNNCYGRHKRASRSLHITCCLINSSTLFITFVLSMLLSTPTNYNICIEYRERHMNEYCWDCLK